MIQKALSSIIPAMPNNPNPQGKGLVPLLQTIDNQRLRALVPPKQIDQIEMELFTSLFVLQSRIGFQPVIGRSYWLYQTDGPSGADKEYRLLLVAPHEWHSPYRGRYIGRCELQEDRTWTLALDPAMAADQAFMESIEAQRQELSAEIQSAKSLEDILPVFEERFGFHARVLAYTLGKSLGISMELSGIHQLGYAEVKGLLDSM